MKKNFDKKSIVGTVVVALVIILILVLLSFGFKGENGYPPQGNSGSQTSGNAPAGTSETQGVITREAAPTNVVVPNENSENLPGNVAKPDVVTQGSPINNSSYRSFEITAQSDRFTPDTIIVNQGDTTNINITAVDKDYDFTQPDYGFKTIIKMGETKKIQFGATASGKFLFYCVSCGGPAKGPSGYIVVAAKK